jgi:hypothetical protein
MHRHACGNEESLLVATEIFRIDKIAVADTVGELLAEQVKRFMTFVTGRFDLYGPYLGPA